MESIPVVKSGTTPTRFQIALALAVLKSKPVESAVRDYILQLRANLTRERQPAANDGHWRLNQAAYWKARFDEAKQRCCDLEHLNTQLERRNEFLQTRPDIEGFCKASPASSKRKKEPSPTRSSKRVKPSQSTSEPSIMSAQGSLIGDINMLESIEGPFATFTVGAHETAKESEMLIHSLYTTYKLCEKQDDLRSLCSSLVQTARAISSVVSTIPRNYDRLTIGNEGRMAPLEKAKSDLALIVQACARAFTSVLVGLEKIAHGIDRGLPSFVVFECVKLFKRALNTISESFPASANGQPTSHARGRNDHTMPENPAKMDGASRAIAQLLIALISYLKRTNRHHREIFEGIFLVLIERVSRLLFYCTFDRHRSATIEGDITPLPAHKGKRIMAGQQIEATAIRLEACALITILERAMALAPHYFNSPLTSGLSVSKTHKTSSFARTLTGTHLPRLPKISLSAQARDMLQRTLITCMFGEEPHDEFAEVLRMPATLGPMPNMPRIKEEDPTDWFRGEVWRLVGWDLLSRETKW